VINYKNHRPSGLNLFAAEPAMFVLEYVNGIKQRVGAPAHRGSAVEDGVTLGLFDPRASMRSCVAKALARYDYLMAMSPDPRREAYRKPIGDMVERALCELRKYGIPTSTQGAVEWHPQELRLPIRGHYDYEWQQHGVLIDLKTSDKMPSDIKVAHARQVALYAGSDNIDARLVYVTPKKLQAYGLENVMKHRKALMNIARCVENLLALSDDPEYFLGLFVPDIDSYYWKNPETRRQAFKLWGI